MGDGPRGQRMNQRGPRGEDYFFFTDKFVIPLFVLFFSFIFFLMYMIK